MSRTMEPGPTCAALRTARLTLVSGANANAAAAKQAAATVTEMQQIARVRIIRA
jgi:hypothetical protein